MRKISITIILIMCIASICVVAEAAKNMGYIFPIADEAKKITQYYSDGHQGIDIGGVKVGTPIYATKAGTVVNRFTGCTNYSRQYGTCKSAGKCSPVIDKDYSSNAYCNWGFGLGFIIRHNDGTWAEYAHMSSVADLKVGSTVEQGTYLGGVGSSGNSSGPHLHFGIRTGNVSSFWSATPLNPFDYMDLDDTGSHTHSYGTAYEAVHPHRYYKKCNCGDYYYTGESYYGNGGYGLAYEAVHPHRQYKACDICDFTEYTGVTRTVDTCTTCNPSSYCVFYDAMGGDFAWTEQWVSAEGGYLIAATPTRDNYTFMGWATIAGGEVAYRPQGWIVPTSDIHLYAVWKNDGDISAVKLESYNGHTYVLYNEILSWEAANVFCQRYGGHLATASSAEENSFIASFASDVSYVWLGATDAAEEGVWAWTTGEVFDYSNWASGEPNEANGEDYLELYTDTCKWNDLSINPANRAVGFVLEFDKEFSPIKIEGYQGHTYELYEETLPWDIANLYCQSRGEHLATASSAEENSFIASFASDVSYVWFGATDAAEEGVWAWTTGEVFDYSNWASGEPNNENNEDYLMLYTDTCKWNDLSMTLVNRAIGFVLEFDKEFSPIKIEDYQGHTYEFYEETLPWDIANLYCQSRGGHLATVSSAEENEFIAQLADEETSVWLGATDMEEEGVWVWTTGEAFDYSNWGSGEPNNTGGVEDYLMLYKKNNMKWNDIAKSAPKYVTGFVCEYENEPEKPMVRVEKTEWSEDETIVMTWDSCEHADYYFPMAYDMDGNRVAVCWGTTDLAYSMNLPAGQYHLYVASVNDGSGKTIYGNAILITVTEKYYTLTFDGNGGESETVMDAKRHNTAYTFAATVPVKTGYTFDQWNTKKDGSGEGYAVGAAYTENQDTVFYATWKPISYKIAYNANGGEGSMENTSSVFDAQISLSKNSYTKLGGKFIGWATTGSATAPEYTDGQIVMNLASSDGQTVTLYAVWAPVPYTTTTVTKYTGYALCHVSLGNMPQGKTLFVAGYLGDRAVFLEKRTTKNATEDFAVIGNVDTVRVFVWDSVQGLVPVTEGETCVVQ